MKKKIIFIVVTVIVILMIVLISIFLKEQSNKMLGLIDNNTDVNNSIIEENSEEGTNNSISINEMQVTNSNNETSETGIIEITEKDFNDEVLNSDKTVLIDFYADWCEPCKILYPIIEEIAEENENIKVVRINVDNEFDLSMQYQVMSIPTMVVIKKGEEVNRMIGVNSKENILSILE